MQTESARSAQDLGTVGGISNAKQHKLPPRAAPGAPDLPVQVQIARALDQGQIM